MQDFQYQRHLFHLISSLGISFADHHFGGYIGIILGLYWGYIRVILGLYRVYIGIMERKMETAI